MTRCGSDEICKNCVGSSFAVLSRKILVTIVACALVGCGGGSSSNTPPPPPANNPVPSLGSLSPTAGTAGGAAFTLTVTGSNFVSSSTVNWNGSSRTTVYVNATQLTASITAADIATAGTANVTVVNPAPGGGSSQVATFIINSSAASCPALTPLNPTVSASACSSSSGHTCLDATFGNATQLPPGGLVVTNTDGSVPSTIDTDGAVAVAQQKQSDGSLRYVAIGNTNTQTTPSVFGVAVVRYNLDGTLDTTFGSGGILTYFAPSSANLSLQDGTTDSAGNILVVGTQNFTSMALLRFTPSGSLDLTFNSVGYQTLPNFSPSTLLLQSDGKIVVAGNGSDNNGNQIGLVVRVNGNGSFDTTFGSNGQAALSVFHVLNALAFQSMNSQQYILAGGSDVTTASEDFTVVRLTPAGSIDTTFGTEGIATTSFCGAGSRIFSLSVDSAGGILAAGRNFQQSSSDPAFALARFESTGALDTTFGNPSSPGQTMLDFYGSANHLTSIQPVLDSGGNELSFVVGGFVTQSTGANAPTASFLALARYHTNGLLDMTFGTNGGVIVDFGSQSNGQSLPSSKTLLIQSDGKIMITGSADFSSGTYAGHNFALARLWP